MNEISKKRWQKLAGILTESQFAKDALEDIDTTAQPGPGRDFEANPKTPKFIGSALDDDFAADGIEFDPEQEGLSVRNYVDEGGGPEGRWPDREDEEEAHASFGGGGKYPATASEYAKQLNDEDPGKTMSLVTDSEHWDRSDIHTGEELAKYLAVAAHQNAFRDIHGVRPRHVDYDTMSVEAVEFMTDEMYRADTEEDDHIDFGDYGDDEDSEPNEFDVEYDKYADAEQAEEDKIFGRS